MFKSLFGPPNVNKLSAKGDINGLLKALEYEQDPLIRTKAAEELGKIGDYRVVDSLLVAHNDFSPEVRRAAAQALVQLNLVETLVDVLKNGSQEQRSFAKTALLKMSPAHVVAKLIPSIGVAEIDELLAEIGDPAVAPVLIAIEKTANINAVSACVEIILKIDPSSLETPMIRMVQTGRGEWAKLAATTLEKIGWKPWQDEASVYFWIAKNNWRACIDLGAISVKPLAEAISTGNKDAITGIVLCIDPQVEWSKGLYDECVHILLSDMQSKHDLTAAETIISLNDRRGVEPFVIWLNENKYPDFLAIKIFKFLVHWHETRVLEPMIGVFLDEKKSVDQRMAAIDAISVIGLIKGNEIQPFRESELQQLPPVAQMQKRIVRNRLIELCRAAPEYMAAGIDLRIVAFLEWKITLPNLVEELGRRCPDSFSAIMMNLGVFYGKNWENASYEDQCTRVYQSYGLVLILEAIRKYSKDSLLEKDIERFEMLKTYLSDYKKYYEGRVNNSSGGEGY